MTDDAIIEQAAPVPAQESAVPDERACWIEAAGEQILGVMTYPTVAARGMGVIFLNGGHGCSSSGKNRIYTRMAADLAGRGFHSLRLEWRGIGDSTGEIDEYVMEEPFLEEAVAAAEVLRSEGVQHISFFGECLGARTAITAAEQIPELDALFLVTLILRDGALSERNAARFVSEVPASDFVRRIGKLRHIGDPKRRALYLSMMKAKARQLVQGARHTVKGNDLPAWVSHQVVDALDGIGGRGVQLKLVYGLSEHDGHVPDFLEVEDDLPFGRYDCLDVEILDEMIAGYRTLSIQDRLVPLVGEWFETMSASNAAGDRAA